MDPYVSDDGDNGGSNASWTTALDFEVVGEGDGIEEEVQPAEGITTEREERMMDALKVLRDLGPAGDDDLGGDVRVLYNTIYMTASVVLRTVERREE